MNKIIVNLSEPMSVLFEDDGRVEKYPVKSAKAAALLVFEKLVPTKNYRMPIHPTQRKIRDLIESGVDIDKMTLLEIGQLIGVTHPQIVKHHLGMVRKREDESDK